MLKISIFFFLSFLHLNFVFFHMQPLKFLIIHIFYDFWLFLDIGSRLFP